ncbi:MAG: DNA starvation/stationary phase protection protein [Fimbriimonadales bacterium]|nr:DNA starvation/stationary phase protection protein [Fimbriimonadales bacterium]
MGALHQTEAPTPAQLSTPSILESEAVAHISQSLAALTADVIALYVKTKNYHWHVTGPHFRSLHLLFDEQAAELIAMVDILAERARKIGGKTIHSISEISRLQRIADDNDPIVRPEEMLKRLRNDNLELAKRMNETKSICERASDAATSAVLDEFIDQAERRVWFLDASIE